MNKNPFEYLASEYEAWFIENKVLFQSELLALKQVVPVDKKEKLLLPFWIRKPALEGFWRTTRKKACFTNTPAFFLPRKSGSFWRKTISGLPKLFKRWKTRLYRG
jgi:hypothetical protein